MKRLLFFFYALLFTGIFIFTPILSFAANSGVPPVIFGIRAEFILFALTLLGVAIFHHQSMYVALIGLTAIVLMRIIFLPDFSIIDHIFGTPSKEGEWRTLLNLGGLLLGFAILAKYFEESGVSDILPNFLPNDWKGGFVLLILISIISSFLDNIAAAMIGGAIAFVVFKGKVHIGYLAGIVAASNAGGAGSVLGDTTTTLMWIDGVSPLDVTHAYIGSVTAIFIFGIFASKQQDKYQRIQKDANINVNVDWGKLAIVLMMLVGAIITNWMLDFPAIGVWVALLTGTTFSKTPWKELPKALQGSIFLLALVTCASLMPVEELPEASWHSAFALGFISAVFDNIPLTKLCLEQGGYDWGILAYTVGFGGSMIWFGSSAGVALSNMYPETRSIVRYLKNGWHVILAYIISFFVMLGIVGWHPHTPHKNKHIAPAEIVAPISTIQTQK